MILNIQLHIYRFSLTVGLFSSSRSTETYLRGEELRFKSCVITVRQSSSILQEVEIARLYQQISFHISFACVNTIG